MRKAGTHWLLVTALAGGLAACAPTAMRTAPQPAIALPDHWSGDAQALPADAVRYWTRLNDPLVDRHVERALANNRDIAQAAARVAQARAGVRAARASFLPQIDASGGVRRNVGDLADDRLQFSLGADAQWEIDLFGRIGNSVAASRADLAAAGYGLADVRRLIAGQVAQTTVSARALAVQRVIARETLTIQDENLQIARWRLQAGLVSSLDVEQAAAQRAQTAASIPALERDFAQAANTISTLIGEPPGAVRAALEADARPIPVPPDATGLDTPAAILRGRPDVRQAEAALLADTARIGVARAQLLPLVRLTGNIGTSSFGIGNLFDVVTGGLFAGVSQLIFDGGRARAQVAGAEAAARASLAVWEKAILGALEDVESAAVALTAARERVVLFGTALEAANNAALLARSQYQSGLIDFQTLLTAESQLLGARNALTASEAERANAFIVLNQALGGGAIDTDLGPDRGLPE
ncbi:efflux transporter outer membrane subunit [Sphingopyxis sp.]|uniref:efflux transporter outer membrane subunit n=1 Tax=Sphingopyxis sp. TaxID=1908224 RepID=UPI0010F8B035|nr:efflux transporter outer membrane subunit [Sphingopyxis sp.]MBR2173595.1 efflux transporter outer membrane subunit [Sphingopyxis sp.]